jgi:hypothetical protein
VCVCVCVCVCVYMCVCVCEREREREEEESESESESEIGVGRDSRVTFERHSSLPHRKHHLTADSSRQHCNFVREHKQNRTVLPLDTGEKLSLSSG